MTAFKHVQDGSSILNVTQTNLEKLVRLLVLLKSNEINSSKTKSAFPNQLKAEIVLKQVELLVLKTILEAVKYYE
jgi:hypothetical protein